MVELRDDERYESFLRVEMLGLSLGRLPIPMMTITEDVETYIKYSEELQLFNKMPPFIRKRLRILQRSIFQLVKQSKLLRGENQEMILKIVDSEVQKFYEQYGEQLCNADQGFEGFGKRFLAFIKDHC